MAASPSYWGNCSSQTVKGHHAGRPNVLSWCSTCLQGLPAACPHKPGQGLRQPPGLRAVRPLPLLPLLAQKHTLLLVCTASPAGHPLPSRPSNCSKNASNPRVSNARPCSYHHTCPFISVQILTTLTRNWGQQPPCRPTRGLPASPMTRGAPLTGRPYPPKQH